MVYNRVSEKFKIGLNHLSFALPMISDKKPVQDFVSLLVRHGISHVVITPGSRNAPFIISLSHHKDIEAHSIADERSAAFVGLGMAQQLKKPVVLICTSGTAALNFSPAIAEAYYQRIPLLIVTADRPIEWIDQGEGQSIRQREVYRNFVKASYEIDEGLEDADLAWHNARIMDEAMRLCSEGVPGPIHLNFPLRESLYQTTDEVPIEVKTVDRAVVHLSLDEAETARNRVKMKNARRILVLAGQQPPNSSLLASLSRFAENPNVVVMTEAHSNLSSPKFITTIDRLVMGFDKKEEEIMTPDLLITIGHNIISRKVKSLLRGGKMEHWHVDESGEGLDTYKHLSKIIPLRPELFFSSIAEPLWEVESDYQAALLEMNKRALRASEIFLSTAEWSDLQVFDSLMKQIPQGYDVQMGNSSVARYILLSDSRGDLQYFGNRGVAGIDGCTSTAIGASFISENPTLLITGDIAFFYDSNAFWNNLSKQNLKIIIINNGGGGIFRIIPGPNTTGDALGTYFETTHERKAGGIALMYNIACRTVSDKSSFSDGLNWLFDRKECAILEVCTPRLENDKVQKSYFKFLKENK